MRHVRSRDYDGGLADFAPRSSLDPADPAASFEAWPKVPLTSEDLRFREEQVRSMLHDRPAMAQYGEKAKPLYRWRPKFPNDDLKQKIRWESSEPIWEGETLDRLKPAAGPKFGSATPILKARKRGKRYHARSFGARSSRALQHHVL